MVDGETIDKKTGKPKSIKRDVINAMSDKLPSNHMWRYAHKERRCRVPMSSWDKWPELPGGGKQRVRMSKPDEPTFMVASPYDENTDPKTGQRVGVYTVCTVPPTVLLGSVHDRAPMVLRPTEYEAWLEGGAASAEFPGRAAASAEFSIQPVVGGTP